MEDRLSQAVHSTPGGGSRDSGPETSQHGDPPSTDVLGILEDIESQFNRLRTIRGEQVDSLRELAERSARLEVQKAQLASDQAALQKTREDWDTQRNQAQSELDDGKQCLDADRRSHERRLEEDKATLARDRESLQSDRERIRHEQGSQRIAMETLHSQLQEKSECLAREEAGIRSEELRLDTEEKNRKHEIDQLISALVTARSLLEKRGLRLRTQRMKIDGYRSRTRRYRSRRKSLECCVRSQRRRMKELEEDRNTQRDQLEEAGRRLHGFMQQLREQGDLVERGNAALALVDSLEGQIEILQSSLEDRQVEVDNDRQMTIKTLEDERDALLVRIESRDLACRDLEQSLQDRPDQVVTEEVEDQTRRLADIACHLHRRRKRLRLLRKGVVRQPRTGIESTDHEARSQQLRQSEIIEQRQLELDEVSRILANSERKMIQKWAVPRSLVMSCWIFVTLAVLAAGSWMAADSITPALRSTSISLSPRVEQNESMDQESMTNWQSVHQNQIKSDGFIRDVAKRSAARRLEPWNSFESVQRLMTDDLSVDDGQPGRITLTLASKEPGKAADFMEILGSSMVVDAQRSLASRPGGHASRIMDGRTQDGLVRHARLNPSVIRDERMVTAGVVFAGGLVVVAMMLSLVYARLLKAKRVFDQEHSSSMDNGSIRPI